MTSLPRCISEHNQPLSWPSFWVLSWNIIDHVGQKKFWTIKRNVETGYHYVDIDLAFFQWMPFYPHIFLFMFYYCWHLTTPVLAYFESLHVSPFTDTFTLTFTPGVTSSFSATLLNYWCVYCGNPCFILMVPIGGGFTKSVLSDRWIVYSKSRKQLLDRKYLLYDTGCTIIRIIL